VWQGGLTYLAYLAVFINETWLLGAFQAQLLTFFAGTVSVARCFSDM
tara:strand:- start:33388 stop:33528 length:141 start_codon:yes stop_codon:yes gene_type:complete